MSTSVRQYHVIILSYLLTHLSARTWELPKCYKDDVRNFSTGENGQGRIEETGGDPTLPQKSRENTSIRSHQTVSIHFLLKCILVKPLFLALCLLLVPYEYSYHRTRSRCLWLPTYLFSMTVINPDFLQQVIHIIDALCCGGLFAEILIYVKWPFVLVMILDTQCVRTCM